MVTGDKLETIKRVGLNCGIVDPIVRYENFIDPKIITEKLLNLKRKNMKKSKKKHKNLKICGIVNGAFFSVI